MEVPFGGTISLGVRVFALSFRGDRSFSCSLTTPKLSKKVKWDEACNIIEKSSCSLHTPCTIFSFYLALFFTPSIFLSLQFQSERTLFSLHFKLQYFFSVINFSFPLVSNSQQLHRRTPNVNGAADIAATATALPISF